MMMIGRLVVAATVLTLASSVSAQGRADFTEADNGRAVRLFSPQFTVELPRNAGTGYHWEFGSRNSRGVSLVSKSGGRSAPHAAGYVGYAQTDRFVVRATAPDGELRIGLLAPGRYDGPERVFRLTFHSAYADAPEPGRYYSPAPRERYTQPQVGDDGQLQGRPQPYGYTPR